MWHSKDIEEVLKELKTDNNGLSTKEALIRLNANGKNELPKKKSDSFIKIMFKQLKDPIVLLLVVAAFFSALIGEFIDSIAVGFIILIDLLMGTFQEWKAEKDALALVNLIKVKSKVLRDNKELEIDSSELVNGDIVLLESGNKISADMRIMESYNLTVDESILTGESLASEKTNKTIDVDTPLADRDNMLYAGCNVLKGRSVCVVCETGINTEIGKIATEVNKAKDTKSPLTIRMEKFSKQISLLVIVLAIIITILLFVKGNTINVIFLSVIALSVSAMPEGLPLALTMALTIASNRMSKKNVIVKKLNSVESLGSCTLIATDKTGTLTVNEQTAKKILIPNGEEFNISGIGYNFEGNIDKSIDSHISLIGKLGVLNNEAKLEKVKNSYNHFGDSIDIAFKALGGKLNIDINDIEIKNIIPYESENKYSAVFYNENNIDYVSIKGSIEKVLSFCKYMRIDDKDILIDKDKLIKQNEDLSSKGYRVIALAYSKFNSDSYEEKDIKDLTFLGLVAFIDPVRKEVKSSINECKVAGIKVVMITGDHPLTAYSIASELDIANDFSLVATKKEVEDNLLKGDKEFDKFVSGKTVFTRVTPIEKLKIVESFKRMGEFVAVTGDGVNDAPALKKANIGVAMGSGTDVAKETSDMIIVDDNFKSIVAGIKEGRNAYSNIRKVSYMLLSCGMAEVLFFILAIAFNYPMPLVAIQLLWLNIVTDGLQDFALSFEKSEKGIMREKPISTKESIFNKRLLTEVLIAGLTIGLTIFIVWVILIDKIGMDIQLARAYIMTLMVFMQNMHVLNCRSEKQSIFNTQVRTNPLIIFSILSALILQFIVCEVPFFSKLLQVESIPLRDVGILFILSFVIILVMEIYKKAKYRKDK